MFEARRDVCDSPLFELANEYGNAMPMHLKKPSVIPPVEVSGSALPNPTEIGVVSRFR